MKTGELIVLRLWNFVNLNVAKRAALDVWRGSRCDSFCGVCQLWESRIQIKENMFTTEFFIKLNYLPLKDLKIQEKLQKREVLIFRQDIRNAQLHIWRVKCNNGKAKHTKFLLWFWKIVVENKDKFRIISFFKCIIWKQAELWIMNYAIIYAKTVPEKEWICMWIV